MALGRRGRNRRRADGLPRETRGERAEGDDDGTESFAQRSGLQEGQRIDVVFGRLDGRDHCLQVGFTDIALQLPEIALEGEVEAGVPVGTLVGPHPYRVVTKAGGFGGPGTLHEAFRALVEPRKNGEA